MSWRAGNRSTKVRSMPSDCGRRPARASSTAARYWTFVEPASVGSAACAAPSANRENARATKYARKLSRFFEHQAAFALPAAFGGKIGNLEAARRLLPVDHRPPAFQVFGAAVFMLQVVGMLPDVVHKHREVALGEGIFVAGSGEHLELAAILLRPRQPDPAGAEHLVAGFVE